MTNILIVSDIHAAAMHLDRDDSVSWMSTLPTYDSPTRNPFREIPALLTREKLTVDYIVCPGDLADCADPTAQSHVWKQLQILYTAIGAKVLLATVGNHDIDSRLKVSSFDPKSTLQSLSPLFPGLEESLCDFYWSRNFAVLEEHDCRFLLINSCAFHGIHSDTKESADSEFRHGRVSDRTVSAISDYIDSKHCKMNILVAHHHFYKNDNIVEDDYAAMIGGSKLLTALAAQNLGPWLVIHGHQHYPDLFYAPGTASSPTILSAGSMSRRLTGSLTGRALNQIYHLDIPIGRFDEVGWKPLGVVRAWDWTDQVGWKRTRFDDSRGAIPFGAGFGCRKDPSAWTDEIANALDGTPTRRLDWRALVQRLPALEFVLPADLRAILDDLKNRKNATTYHDSSGFPAEVGLK